LPPLIAGTGDRAALHFLEFFTVNIRNKNMRAAYARAAAKFLHRCEGPRHSVSKGSRPVLSSGEATALLTGMDVSSVVGLRDRAIIAAMTYTFARVGTVVTLTVEDYFSQKKRWWLRLHEKNGRLNEMPCHHKLEEYLDAYMKAAGIGADHKGPLFRSAIGKTGQLSGKPMLRGDV
jgi:integrase/recombinase XerD